MIVDEHVDVHDYNAVMFYVGANVDPKRDIVSPKGPLDHLDHAPTLQFIGGKIGIDATAKGPLEGAREWPPEIEMAPRSRSSSTAAGRSMGSGSVPPAGERRGSVRVRAGCYDVDAATPTA